MIQYKVLEEKDITVSLFGNFHRHQIVDKCWRKKEGRWQIESAPFIDDWTEEEYEMLVSCLKNTVVSGGFVMGAFEEEALKGFVSVESLFFGTHKQYLDLSAIHISEEMRGQGLGTQLFIHASQWAKDKGAKKLYISAHSAVESQAFYKAMGCVEAVEYNMEHVEKEPYDCQLEYIL